QYSCSTVIPPTHPHWPALIYVAGTQAGSPTPRTARRAARAAHRDTRAAPRHAPAVDPQLRAGIARQPLHRGRGLRPPDRRGTDRVAPRFGFLRAVAQPQAGAAPRRRAPDAVVGARRELAAARAAPAITRQRTARRRPAAGELAGPRTGGRGGARRRPQPRFLAAQVRLGRGLSTAARGAGHAARASRHR